MLKQRFLSALAAFLLGLSMLAVPTAAVEVDSGSTYCFCAEDFSQEEAIRGICITGLPNEDQGSTLLGNRVLRPGDILTADQVAQMTFCPVKTETDITAQVEYLPIYESRVADPAVMTIGIRGKEDKPPVAEDSTAETYKNLPNTGKLRASDPEGEALTFTIIRQPKRGTVAIAEDGTFTYTPKKNKVGLDSFVFTATDAAGKVSREATVTVSILKPTDARQYSDTIGKSCRFAAEWMKNTGIFVGENLGGSPCFSPERQVTRGEFVTMLVKALNIPTDADITETGYADAPDWLKPYLAAAVRSGLTANLTTGEEFCPEQPVTAEEAAAMLCSALKLEPLEQPALSAPSENALTPLEIALQNGLALPEGQTVTRADCAKALYQASRLQTNP